MKVDSYAIVQETVKAFENSGAIEFYKKCPYMLHEQAYKDIHPKFLTPLDIKIDANSFHEEIVEWQHTFEQWGNNHIHLPRYGAALVNQRGDLIKKDPVNGSLMAWNQENPFDPLIETDCVMPTALMSMSCLKPLSIFNEYWCRSNILKWNKGAMFVPHIDTVVPSMWIRLWASLSNNVVVRYAHNDELVPVEFEVGRVYVIDTSIVHDATALSDNVYQLFLGVLPMAKDIISEKLITS